MKFSLDTQVRWTKHGISNPPIVGVACSGSINYMASPGLVLDSGSALTLHQELLNSR
jgi:hypothetical protein